MATKAEAIDALIDELAGQDVSTRGTIAERIQALTAAVHDGTISLGGGGGGAVAPLVVTVTPDEETGEQSADKTFAEISAARAAGRNVLATARLTPDSPDISLLLVSVTSDAALFVGYAEAGAMLDLYVLLVSAEEVFLTDPLPVFGSFEITLADGEDNSYVCNVPYAELYSLLMAGVNVTTSLPGYTRRFSALPAPVTYGNPLRFALLDVSDSIMEYTIIQLAADGSAEVIGPLKWAATDDGSGSAI